MTQTIRPFLMFQDGQAEAAMTFYVSLFPDSEILDIDRYGSAGPGPDGSVIRARFRIGDLEVFCSDSFVKHAFDFTPSTSLFVDCGSESEIARQFAALAAGGAELMPIGDYGFSRRFAWINDRFGVSWQLNLA